jgi:hypothetical protein
MAPQSQRSAALLVSVHVDSDGNPAWLARITSYRDAFGPSISLATQTSVDGICDVLRDWLISVIKEEPGELGGSAGP